VHSKSVKLDMKAFTNPEVKLEVDLSLSPILPIQNQFNERYL